MRGIFDGRLYTGRNLCQIWAELAVWANRKILIASHFYLNFYEKWLSGDYYMNLLSDLFGQKNAVPFVNVEYIDDLWRGLHYIENFL